MQTFEESTQAVARAVEMYNTARPHQSLGGKTPLQLLVPEAPNPLVPSGGGGGGAVVPLGEGYASGGRIPSWCISRSYMPRWMTNKGPSLPSVNARCEYRASL
ncbi:integrase core domain-containing protein [Porphyromonas sp.]